jgi:hypothetical protein
MLTSQPYAMAEGKRIIKWIDNKGVTHYGDTLPVKETGKNNTELSKNGIALKKNTQAKNNEAISIDKEKLEQQRKDNILLSSYTNAEEIDLARDRNLEMANATLQAITVQKENITSRIERNNQEIEGYSKRNKPVPSALTEKLKTAKSESRKKDGQIANQKLNIEATKKRYAEEKSRFVTLKTPKQKTN